MKKYKIGMYGGKFMPFHIGHLHCIEEAAKQCDTLYVLIFHGGDQELQILLPLIIRFYTRSNYSSFLLYLVLITLF